MKNQQGFAHILGLIVLIAGLAVGLVLVGQTQIFKPRASGLVSSPISGPIPTPSTPTIKVSFKDSSGKPISQTACGACWNANGGYTKVESCKTGIEVVINKPGLCNTYNPVLGIRTGYQQQRVESVLAEPTKNYKTYINQYFGWSDIKTWTSGQRTLNITVQPSSRYIIPTPKPAAAKRVFVTSTTYNGNLGGLSGADAKCQSRASAANLGGIWKAWLSSSASGNYPFARFNKSNGVYKNVIGDVIANNWADLTDGKLTNSITVDERGVFQSIIDPFSVWTNTRVNGYSPAEFGSRFTCNNWTSNSSFLKGIGGASWKNDSDWTWVGTQGNPVTQSCNTLKRLYCFEQ